MFTATRIRLYPTDEQAALLHGQFGCARWVWNDALAIKQKTYLETGKSLGYHTLSKRLPALKVEHPWLAEAYAQVLQQSLQNLCAAFDAYFHRRSSYPRFKTKDSRQSILFPQGVKLDGRRIYVPKIGWTKCVVHRPIVGEMRTVTVSRTRCGHYYASILTDDAKPAPQVSTVGKVIGIDLGIKDFVVTSDGVKIRQQYSLATLEANLKRKQRKSSRTATGSKGREKARLRVARVYERIANARKDFLHKLSTQIVSENQVIVVEDLHVKGMVKNPNLAKAIGDAGWSTFTTFLEYKAARAGKAVIRVDRFYPSSKACSECGTVNHKLALKTRVWTCQNCNTRHDRDINAAKNIRSEGIRRMAVGMTVTAGGGLISRRKQLAAKRIARANETGSSGLAA